VLPKEVAQPRHQEPRRATRYPESNQAGRLSLLAAHGGGDLVGQFDQVAGVAEQVLPVFSEAEVAGRAVKQPQPEMLFELSDESGHGGVASVAFARHGGE
jgi:hypothetical protein